MGVHGLWRLIEPSGKPVPFETLENKVLAVDISLWLHQAVAGFQDSRGAPLPNAHLLGIYHRLCKLLYFRIKPIFVFDGGVPELKRQTIAKRKQSKSKNANRAEEIQKELLHTILKHTAISKVLEDQLQLPGKIETYKKKNVKDDMFVLDNIETSVDPDSTLSSSEEDTSCTEGDSSSPSKHVDLHSVDLESQKFKSLPVDVRHEILTDLKETRKQSSWGRIHQIPKISDEFSSYQMKRLLKRQAVQSALEQAEKEMGGKTLSLAELESMLQDQGIITDDSLGRKIASDEHAKYLLVKANKKEAESKKLQPIIEESNQNSNSEEFQPKNSNKEVQNEGSTTDLSEDDSDRPESNQHNKADQEYQDDLQKAIALSLMAEPSTSNEPLQSEKRFKSTQESFIEKFADADFMSSSSDEDFEEVRTKMVKHKTLASAEHYMIEYSGLTPSEIAKIIESKTPQSKNKIQKHKTEKVKEIVCTKSKNEKINTLPEIHEEKNIKLTENDKPTKENKVCPKQTNDILDKIEVMSSSSEDSNGFVEVDSSEANIVINPNDTFNEKDDIFSDVFVSKSESQIQVTVSLRPDFDEKDDLFGDLFGSIKDEENTGVTSKCSEKIDKIQIEIIPEENLKDDLFSDIFSSKNLKTDQNILTALDPNTPDKSAKPSQIDKKEEGDEEKIYSTVPVIQDAGINLNESLGNLKTKEENKITLDLLAETSSSEIPIDNLTETKDGPSKVTVPDDSIEIINHLQKANRTGSLNKQLTELKNKLQEETNDLLSEKGAKQRMAENITDQMYQEAQDLLELFGVPYIIAPMEAEAQCAFLDEIELTNGTITDDSDIWLFGGRTVYKNFFNQNKYVMEFRTESIEHHFKLTREQMILLALLVGSDYTNGLQGVGPVTALEILSAFPPSKLKESDLKQLVSGLKEFRSWFTKGKSPGLGRTNLKKKLKNITFTDNFPSIQVVQAYLDPKVETSDELFSWGKPNFDALIEFAKDKFGWTASKAEQIVNPVLKRMQESRTQKSIKDYFAMKIKMTDSGKVQDQMSKRVKSAVTNMGKDPDQRIADELAEEIAMEFKKKPVKRKTDNINENSEAKSKRSRQKKNSDTKIHEVSSTGQESEQITANVDDDKPSGDIKVTENTKSVKRRFTKKSDASKKPRKSTRTNSNQEISEDQNLALCDIDVIINEKDRPTLKKQTKKAKTKENTEKLKDNQNIICGNDEDIVKETELRVKIQTKKGIAKRTEAKAKEKSVPEKSITLTEHTHQGSENESTDSEDEIINKIALIRQRRENKTLKKQLEGQSATKLKTKENKNNEKDKLQVPEELKGDEDVNLLIQTALISGSKVEQIYKQAQEDIDNIQASTSKSTASSAPKPGKSNLRPSVPKRTPRVSQKDVIPQKTQDQANILRNKMRAIEIFRKGKKGPGYVPKREKKRRIPKNDAELSESSE